MKQQNIGGVQAHSVGHHYPIIVVGYGDDTWRAEYAGVRSAPVKTAQEAIDLAQVAHGQLQAYGVSSARLALAPSVCMVWITGLETTVRISNGPDAFDTCKQWPSEKLAIAYTEFVLKVYDSGDTDLLLSVI